MTCFDTELEKWAWQVDRKRQLDGHQNVLQERIYELEEKVRTLEWQYHCERSDVEKLEKGSLKAFWYRLAGTLEEKRQKEEEEALAAQIRHAVAVKELDEVRAELKHCQEEKLELQGCEAQYAALLEQKKEKIRSSGTAQGMALWQMEEEIVRLDNFQREIREAIFAGRKARKEAKKVADSLDSADGYATWDMLGGGLFADLAKYEHLDDAQEGMECLQAALRRFGTELADVKMQTEIQVNVDGFLRFADYFFDGFFVDWTVKDKIHDSQEQVEETMESIDSALEKLDGMLEEGKHKQEALRKQAEELVKQIRI